MKITFRVDGNFGPYKAGRIYSEELTPQLKRYLLSEQFTLIDPLYIDETPYAAPVPEDHPEPVPTPAVESPALEQEPEAAPAEEEPEPEPDEFVVKLANGVTRITDTGTTPKAPKSLKAE